MKDFMNLVDKDHIVLFCEVLNISPEDIQNIYVNPGRSANNRNFVFVANNMSYLYRIPGAGTEKFCSRTRESLAYEILAPLNITDEVLYLSDETGIKISKYYEESKIPSNNSRAELIASMHTLRKLHEHEIRFPYTDTLFDRMERYREYANEVGGEKYYLPGFDVYLDNISEFKNYLDGLDTKSCFTHGDASINNILITKEHNYPILIDIEFPAMGDPFEDIATFCVDAEYRANEIIMMLEYYLDREATLNEKYHVLGLSAVAAMMWYSWAAYKCAVENNNQLYINFRNDYHQYVEEVYNVVIDIYKEMTN